VKPVLTFLLSLPMLLTCGAAAAADHCPPEAPSAEQAPAADTRSPEGTDDVAPAGGSPDDSEPSIPPAGDIAEDPSGESQLGKLEAIETATSLVGTDAVSAFLGDPDAAVQAASFHALAAQDSAFAVGALVAEVNDPGQSTRLQSLDLLVQSPETDEETVKAALQNALHDPDPAFNAYAVQALGGRDDPAAWAALREAFDGDDVSLKLMILDAVARTSDGAALLHQALSDTNAAVSNAAATRLQELAASTEANP
jgi:hypothetical protein